MIDEEKVKRLRMIAGGIGIVLLLLLSYGVGQLTAPKPSQEETSTQTKTKEELAYQDVNDFLSAYYTKKDLGTNRNRYKPFMTENLYKQEVSKEEEAVSQTYKGYVVDFEFKEADIYINTKTNIALVQVTYTNTLLEKKDNYEKAQKNVRNRTILKLSYIRDKEGELKLNAIQPAVLQLSGEEEPNLPDYGTITTTEETGDE
ncbi:hypothetical protein [Streptococcus suis]